MADIELVIKIPEEDYLVYSELSEKEKVNELTYYEKMIANGTPLPKGYGRLIDANLLKNQFPIWVDSFSSRVVNNTISKAPTIIEADKE